VQAIKQFSAWVKQWGQALCLTPRDVPVSDSVMAISMAYL
jgi:hypothetical protein